MSMYGRNFAYAIRVPVTTRMPDGSEETQFKVEYHSPFKAIMGRLIHWPGEKIKEFYMSDKTRKYEQLARKRPQLMMHGLHEDEKRRNVIGGQEVNFYIVCQSGQHSPHKVSAKSMPLRDGSIILSSTRYNCDGPDYHFCGVKYTLNDVLANCKHIEAMRDIINYPLDVDKKEIRVKACVPGTREDIYGRVQQIFEPILDPESDFGKTVVSETIEKYFFEKSMDADKSGNWTQYECDLRLHLKYGEMLLSDKAKAHMGNHKGMRCGWEVVKGETGKNKRGVDPVYTDALRRRGYVQAGTVLDMEGNFDRLSLGEKVFELSAPERIVWEHLRPGFDGYVRFIPVGMFQWVRIGLPTANEDFAEKARDNENWKKLVERGARVVPDSVTGKYSVELPVPDPEELDKLMETLEQVKNSYRALKKAGIL